MPKAQRNATISADEEGDGNQLENNAQVQLLRVDLQAAMDSNLETLTGIRDAKMIWRSYRRDVACKYGVTIDGWPGHLIKPLSTLRAAAPSIHKAQEHLRRWNARETRFRFLTADELVAEEALRVADAAAASAKRRTRRGRADAGSKRLDRQRGVAREERERVFMNAKSPEEVTEQDMESEDVRQRELEELRHTRNVLDYVVGNPLYYM
ncbi:hypothetical protein FA95DRAFT_1578357 [Auriscalpium vulgare]|uniref:Uncharacterized protein n=1 Tax=Auriscalpium vulgare TaxID=40419 RepID=A0ACB8R3I2_9AGAM|nr:hypothetical protein FA95DRAFT_1578357 [Auriscalpium vulgare]